MPAVPDQQRADEAPVSARTVRALILLTMIAGMIDAVAFLGLDQVFAANMTGNVVLLGLAIGGAPALSINGPAVALAAFLAGAAIAGRGERRDQSRHYYVVRMVRVEAVVVAAAALLAIGFDPDDESRRLLIIAVLAMAMGARNEEIRRVRMPELRTTVLTLAIAGFAAHEAEGHRRDRGDRLRFVGIVAMVIGAIASALLVLNADVVWALVAIAAAEVLALLMLGRPARVDRVQA
ncbi:MAG TPA: YoaK family protein [Solirubrobacterales bacterium]|nr:YoaK family protein [Solirubrobacterales bacterium]